MAKKNPPQSNDQAGALTLAPEPPAPLAPEPQPAAPEVKLAPAPEPPALNRNLDEAPNQVPVFLAVSGGAWCVGYRVAGLGQWFVLDPLVNAAVHSTMQGVLGWRRIV